MPNGSKLKLQPEASGSDSDQYEDEISLFHKQREKILLDSDQAQSEDTDEEEVYPLVDNDDDSEDDEEIAGYQQQLRQLKRNKFKKKLDSDFEEEAEDDGLPDARAWGSQKSWFMGGDVRDNKIILSGSEDEAGAAAMEEKEAIEIQKRHAAFMTEEDFMIPLSSKMKTKQKKKKDKGKKTQTEDTDNEENEIQGLVQSGRAEAEKIQADFSNLSRKEELEIMKRLHPEYIPLVSGFNAKCVEMRERILPLMGLVRQDRIQGLGKDYVLMKYHIITNYLSNGITYMKMVANREQGIHQHPVIKRIVQFENLYKRLVPVDERVKPDVDDLLECLQQGEDVGMVLTEDSGTQPGQRGKTRRRAELGGAAGGGGGAASKKRKTALSAREEAKDEESDDDDDGKEDGGKAGWSKAEGDGGDEAERRAITYQMEKNKGLTAHKKKEARNPRVKHRNKFRRAQIRRKGQVRDYKAKGHSTIYSGEATGIRAGIIRSRKLK